ncbi:MAG: flagellar FliJ family protein [Terriglobales bacterium]|jgi:flagellar FliJ protein
MPFRFSLDAVLKYREALELREFVALEKAQQEIALLESQIVEAEQNRLAREQNRAQELRRGMRSKHLQDALDDEQALEHLRDELKKKQEELAIKRQEIFQAYQEARRNREIIEKLRERKLADYTRSQTKAEQARIDDLFLARRKPTS